MPSEILCRTVEDDVRAQVKRILKVRTQERVVDDSDCMVPRCDLRYGLDVTDLQKRVGGRLQPDHLRPLTHRSIDVSYLPRVDVREIESEVGEDLAEEPPRAAVEVIEGHDVVPLLQQREYQGGLGRKPRGESERVSRLFEGREAEL